MTLKVTAIILAKDEAETIGDVLEGVKPYVDSILVVDGHSSDGTGQLAGQAGAEVISDNGRGKGDAYKVAFQHSGEEGVLVFLDGDGSHEPADIPKLVEPIARGDADMTIASRIKAGSDDVDSSFSCFVRNVGGMFITMVINLRFRSQITDVLNGYRALRVEVARSLNPAADDFDVEHEMIMKALKRGWKVVDVPSHEYARAGGKSKLPTFRKAYKFFWRLFINLF